MAENTKQPVFKRKLKNYLINRHDQLRIVLMTLIYMSLIAIVTLAIVLYPLISDIFFAQDMGIQYRASQAFLVLINRLVPTVIIMFILIAFHQIIITHRIWGPLVNFTNTVKKIGDGDLTRKIVLRKKDYLKEECRQINVMIDGLIRLVSNVRTSHSKLISALEEVVVIPIEDLKVKKIIEDELNKVRLNAGLLSDDISKFKFETESHESCSDNM